MAVRVSKSKKIIHEIHEVKALIYRTKAVIRIIDANRPEFIDYEVNRLSLTGDSRYRRPLHRHLGARRRERHIDQQTGQAHTREISYDFIDHELHSAPGFFSYRDATDKLIPRTINRQENRGRSKNTVFTKKMSFSLLRRDSKNRFFRGNIGQNITSMHQFGMLFDLDKMHTKGEKFIWDTDGQTLLRHWSGKYSFLHKPIFKWLFSPILPDAISGNELRLRTIQASNTNKKQLWYKYTENELMICAQAKALKSLFAIRNNFDHRIKLLELAFKFKLGKNANGNKFGFDVPLMIIDGQHEPVEYYKAQMKEDLRLVHDILYKNKKNSKKLKNKYNMFIEDLQSLYNIDIKTGSANEFANSVIKSLDPKNTEGQIFDESINKKYTWRWYKTESKQINEEFFDYLGLENFISYWDNKYQGDKKSDNLLQVLSDNIVNVPYIDRPGYKLTYGKYTVWHPNHDTSHSVRQYIFAKTVIDLIKEQSDNLFKLTADELSKEEESCILLAAYLFRVGRTNEKSWDEDLNNQNRSRDIFKLVASRVGYNQDLINQIAYFMTSYNRLYRSADGNIFTDSNGYKNDESGSKLDGFTGNKTIKLNKAILAKRVLDIAHHIDLQRCWSDRNGHVIGPVIVELEYILGNSTKAREYSNRLMVLGNKLAKQTGAGIIPNFFNKWQMSIFNNNKLRVQLVKNVTGCIDNLFNTAQSVMAMSLKNTNNVDIKNAFSSVPSAIYYCTLGLPFLIFIAIATIYNPYTRKVRDYTSKPSLEFLSNNNADDEFKLLNINASNQYLLAKLKKIEFKEKNHKSRESLADLVTEIENINYKINDNLNNLQNHKKLLTELEKTLIPNLNTQFINTIQKFESSRFEDISEQQAILKMLYILYNKFVRIIKQLFNIQLWDKNARNLQSVRKGYFTGYQKIDADKYVLQQPILGNGSIGSICKLNAAPSA